MSNAPLLLIVVVLIVGSVIYLERSKPKQIEVGNVDIPLLERQETSSKRQATGDEGQEISDKRQGTSDKEQVEAAKRNVLAVPRLSVEEKNKLYPRAKELVAPSGFINTPRPGSEQAEPFKIADFIGQRVILVDFWTYSCINCQRTLPYLTAWDKKYRDQGLLIVGVHTPEFDFEKIRDNVVAATKKFGIQYPVVQDNDYGTWRAYQNRYWPHKYLIDIDGFIVYDHIGEGAYQETEKKIQALLQERAAALNLRLAVPTTMVQTGATRTVTQALSPEIYFGADRNEYFGNGLKSRRGEQTLTLPAEAKLNMLYLGGTWNLTGEYAENKSVEARIVFRYQAKAVYLVARASQPVKLKVLRDGQLVQTITVQADQLYTLIDEATYGEHTLELEVQQPGLQVYTFTFG